MLASTAQSHGAPRRLVPAVDRAARVLARLRDAAGPCSLTELAVALGINKATVLDILLTLCHHGLVERDPASKRFALGPALATYSAEAWGTTALRAGAKPVLRALSARTGETAALGVVRRGRLLFLDSEASGGDFQVAVPVGRELPLVATSVGKVLCAHLAATELDEVLRREGLPRFTARSVADAAAFRRQLAAVRAQGYTLDRGEYAEGVYGLAAPVWGPGGRVVAGIAVVGLDGRLTEGRTAALRDAVVEAGRTLAHRLGGAPAQGPGPDTSSTARCGRQGRRDVVRSTEGDEP